MEGGGDTKRQQTTKLLSSLLCSLFGFGFGLVEKTASAPKSWGYTHQKTNSVEVEKSGKGGLGRGGGEEEEEGEEGGNYIEIRKGKEN